ncbi:MAG: hypothetical protein ACKO9Q_18380, partial [Pirellula sp.]
MLTPTQMFLVCKRIIVAIILSVALCAVGIAQESATGRIDTIDLKVRSGLEGRWKVGFSTWHRVEINATEELTGWLEIQTVDGDGNELAYSDPGWSFQAAPGSTAVVDIYAKHGRADRPIRIVASVKGRKALVHLLSESERGQALSATDPWVVGIGTSRLDLDQG